MTSSSESGLHFHRLRGVMAIVLLGCALGLRLFKLGQLPGMSGDEAYAPQLIRDFFLDQGPWPWLTPTHRVLAPQWTGSLALIHGLEPSVLSLRLLAVGASLLAVVLAGWLLPRVLPRSDALASTFLIAVHPTYIAYSRVAWELAWVPVASVLISYSVWRGKWRGVLLAFGFGALVHASVALLAPFACFYLVELNWGRKRAIQVAIWLGVALATLTFWVPSSGFFGLHLKPRDWIESLRLIPQFVGGTTAYREFAGEPTREFRAAVDLSVATLLFAVIGLGVRRAWRHRGPFKGDFTAVSSPALALGINFVAIILFLGPTPFRLEFERYALPLLVPLLMVLVQAIRTQFGKRSELLLWGAGLASVMSFAVGYFHPASPPAAWAYRTESGRESKTRLAQDVLRRCATGGVVITEDWWTYWPFRFLLSQSPQIRVLHEGGDSGLPVRDLVNRSDRRSSEGRWPCGLRVSRVRPGLAGGAIAHTVLSDGFGVEFLNAEGWPSPPEAQTQ